MKTSIIPVGNGRGIILPPDILHQVHLSFQSVVNVSVEGQSIVIKSEPRQGWADAFKQYALSGKEEFFS